MRIAFQIRQIRQSRWKGWAIGLAAFAVAFVVRWLVHSLLLGLPYITFFTATLIAGLFGGLTVAIAILVLCVLTAWFFFVPPFFSFQLLELKDFIGLCLFTLAGAIEIVLVNVMNGAIDELYFARERAEVLFKELQHRVANNLAFVAAILDRQRRAFEPGSAAAMALADSQERLIAMAQIHRGLYDPALFTQPLGQHLHRLCSDLIGSSGQERVDFSVEADNAVLDLDRLVPLLLIVMEIVTNSLKHAFPAERKGHIQVTLTKSGQELRLSIADDGVGHANPGAPTGLGTTIINSLVTQIGAQIDMHSGTGTRVDIKLAA